MEWIKFTIETTATAEELITAVLDKHGIYNIEIEDFLPVMDELQGQVYAELQPDLPVGDNSCKIHFYLDEGMDYEDFLVKLRSDMNDLKTFCDIGSGKISITHTKEEDWRNEWKKYFHSFCIDNILIKPQWEELHQKDKNKILIEMDPGISFGTGKHETTQLCIKGLQQYLKPDNKVLDVGCGSGILSIVALKLNATHVTGIDIDPDCLLSTRENMEQNHLALSQGDFYVGNLTDDISLQQKVGINCYDVVVANILADIIIGMSKELYDAVKPGGYLITSGIIDFKEIEVKEALNRVGFQLLEVNHLGEWVSVIALKEK